jgi:hypothetical protein
MEIATKCIEAAKERRLPLLLDGDGLFLISQRPALIGMPLSALCLSVYMCVSALSLRISTLLLPSTPLEGKCVIASQRSTRGPF